MTNSPGLDVTAGAAPTTRKLAATSKQETQDLIDDAMRLVSVLDLKLVCQWALKTSHRKALQNQPL